MRRCNDFIVPQITLDRDSDIPLRSQLYRQIAHAIQTGAIHRGAGIPSSRLMARLLQVSRNTVFSAYDDLAADGLLQAERGAGMRVSGFDPSRGLTLFGLRDVVRAANYPAKVLALSDPDGNSLYINMK